MEADSFLSLWESLNDYMSCIWECKTFINLCVDSYSAVFITVREHIMFSIMSMRRETERV